MNVAEAIAGRRSVRAYLERPVPREQIEELLETARWSPSGVNTQPWQVVVVSGAAKRRLGEALEAARRAGEPERPDYRYYPEQWREPYRGRRKACGVALYGALGIDRGAHAAQLDAWCANYRFFDAPVGLLFLLDRDLGQGSWLDLGMFMQSVMLAAHGHGLATCPQASLADYPDRVRAVLGLEEGPLLVAGMALGWPDPTAPVNRYRTGREPVAAFTRFFD